MNKKIYLAHYAQSNFGKLGEITVDEMIQAAISEGLEKLDRKKIDFVTLAALLAPLLNGQSLVSGIVAMDPDFVMKPIKTVENACASGSEAVLDVTARILAGLGHVGLAIGLEKMNEPDRKTDSKKVGLALGTAAHMGERFDPFSFPHLFALLMRDYINEYGATEEQFANISVLFYKNASFNPLAHMFKTRAPVTVEAVMNSYRLFQEPEVLPLKLFDCSQISDGWARILVMDDEGLEIMGIPKQECTLLAGFGQATDTLALNARGKYLLKPLGARKAFNDAMEMAGTKIEDVKVQEIHDCFNVMGPLAVETTGLAEPGQGLKYFLEGQAEVGARCPINTSGGLIAKGHPISATGLAMIGWNHWQILGKVPPEVQVKNADVATTLNIGGPICATAVTVQQPAG
ncbi:thiolase family protein [candidate division CSSED10-310 bacterium]|uniref:propanoyl-CoA C-acyltransferase n=1 Tax=candidate division CSSED10-310 bacterium TaxID=2855610 RepID=A0ABV6Z0R6_UNCC1